MDIALWTKAGVTIVAVVCASVPGSAGVSVLFWCKPTSEAVTAVPLHLVSVLVETSVFVFVVVVVFWGLKFILVERTFVFRGLCAKH